MILYARAKVNLMLRVTGRLENGWHELEMINGRVSLCDTIFIEEHESTEVMFSSIVIDDKENIVLQAIRSLVAIYHIPHQKVYIEKRIPVMAGLGGGSADLAEVVKYLSKMYGIFKTQSEMAKFCQCYSSDSVYCLEDSFAYVTGVGQIVIPMKIVGMPDICLFIPPKGNKTGDIFKKVSKFSDKIMKYGIINTEMCFDELKNSFINDLEEIAFGANTRSLKLKNDLREVFEVVQMSGSGSTVFCLYENKDITKIQKFARDNPDIKCILTKFI